MKAFQPKGRACINAWELEKVCCVGDGGLGTGTVKGPAKSTCSKEQRGCRSHELVQLVAQLGLFGERVGTRGGLRQINQ